MAFKFMLPVLAVLACMAASAADTLVLAGITEASGSGALVSQQVIELADGASEGVYGHTGVSVDADNAGVRNFAQRYQDKFRARPDHNSLKGYFAMYAIKFVADAKGTSGGSAFIAEVKKARLNPALQPNVLVRAGYDHFGNLYRESYLVQVRNGRQSVLATIPATEGQVVELASGKEVTLNSPEGRKQFLRKAQRVANKERQRSLPYMRAPPIRSVH